VRQTKLGTQKASKSNLNKAGAVCQFAVHKSVISNRQKYLTRSKLGWNIGSLQGRPQVDDIDKPEKGQQRKTTVKHLLANRQDLCSRHLFQAWHDDQRKLSDGC
jgi:hypothetical protein